MSHFVLTGSPKRKLSLQTKETDSKGRHPDHTAVNEVIKQSLDAAKVPCHLKPTGLYWSDGKWPHGVFIVPWKGGKVLVWDATCTDTLTPSYSALATREAYTYANILALPKRV